MCTDTFDSYDQHYGRGLVKDTLKDGMYVCETVCLMKFKQCLYSSTQHVLKPISCCSLLNMTLNAPPHSPDLSAGMWTLCESVPVKGRSEGTKGLQPDIVKPRLCLSHFFLEPC